MPQGGPFLLCGAWSITNCSAFPSDQNSAFEHLLDPFLIVPTMGRDKWRPTPASCRLTALFSTADEQEEVGLDIAQHGESMSQEFDHEPRRQLLAEPTQPAKLLSAPLQPEDSTPSVVDSGCHGPAAAAVSGGATDGWKGSGGCGEAVRSVHPSPALSPASLAPGSGKVAPLPQEGDDAVRSVSRLAGGGDDGGGGGDRRWSGWGSSRGAGPSSEPCEVQGP
jgi:hypothetical protein